MKSSLDLSTLESHLWEAANILRGPVDAADFKTYIFPLLFFKRISDVYDEERTQVEAEYGEGIDFAESHRFQIPEGCHWRDVRAHTTNVGHALQNALRGIERPIRAHFTASLAMPSGRTRSASPMRCCAI